MVLEVIHLILMFALLACGLVVVWYTHRIHALQSRGLALRDAQDLDARRIRSGALKARDVWHKEVGNWLRDTRAILGKLYAIAAETSFGERETYLMPPRIAAAGPALASAREEAEEDRPSDSDAETRCLDGRLARAAIAPSSDPASDPGPAPRATAAPVSGSRMLPGAPRGVTPPTPAIARFPETLVSMRAAPASGGGRRASTPALARIETKALCRSCDGGFIAVGNGGIGKCHVCDGSGFVDAR